MKKMLSLSAIFIVLFISSGCSQQNEDLKWTENLETALQTAKAENKTVLINFTGSDWCQWCKRLNSEVFSQDEFAEYAKENLVLVRLDFPRTIKLSPETVYYNNKLAQQFGVQGFPTIILMDKNGNVLTYTGYREGGAANYVQHIKSFVI